jgi:hypothetical protein
VKRLCIAALLAGTSLNAHALGRLADVSIIDRETGAAIPTHYYKGEYWIVGTPGAQYGIAIHNRSGERVLAVTAVDGVNVISGDTASWEQTGYVFEPRQGYQIDGWRKSDAEIAAFVFTGASGSYAARTGRAANVGVIGVALFRERPPPPTVAQSQAAEPPRSRWNESDAAANAPNAPSAANAANAAGAAAAPMLRAARPSMTEKLGTGHGQRESSYVTQTDFERLQATPNELIRLRYDSLENLLAMGVIRTPPTPSLAPDPFPASPLARYVPDPPDAR